MYCAKGILVVFVMQVFYSDMCALSSVS